MRLPSLVALSECGRRILLVELALDVIERTDERQLPRQYGRSNDRQPGSRDPGCGHTVVPTRIVSETVSGSVAASQRPGFQKLLERLEAGDVLIVTKLDRLGRSAVDVRSTVDRLSDLGVQVKCLQLGGADLTSPAGRMTMQVLGAVAEFERDLLLERTQAGLSRAKAEGKRLGRRPALPEHVRTDVAAQLAAGASVRSLAARHGVARSTIMRLRPN